MFMTKKQAQLLLLAAGVLMLLFGIWRGEADTVFSKAIRLGKAAAGVELSARKPARCWYRGFAAPDHEELVVPKSL